MTRRSFLAGLAVGTAASPLCRSSLWQAAAPAPKRGASFEPWKRGELHIHHISTGRGNCTLLICPDGTTMMIDAGAISREADCGKCDDGCQHIEPSKYTILPKPNGSLRPGQWIARYASRQLSAIPSAAIDYFILTHFHSDHMGAVAPECPVSKHGSYRLTGVTDVAEVIPIRRFIDRGFPDYGYPVPVHGQHLQNYISFIRSQVELGVPVEQLLVGSQEQIRILRSPLEYPSFSVRNLAANGVVWAGVRETTRQHFPDIKALAVSKYPSENMCSLALRVSYGIFRYYTGGDLTCSTNYGSEPWRDIETPVAEVAGPVDVAVANHHGYIDAEGPGFVRSLRPRAFVLFAWNSDHPSLTGLAAMLSGSLYPNERDVYATAVKPENEIVTANLCKLKSRNGHVVLRVRPGGNEFRVIILDNEDETDQVWMDFGPFPCG